MAPDVRLVDVVKEFPELRAVDGISLEIPRGSFFALLGPSGCGKTTTLRMIGGFEEPTSGQIFLADRDVVGLPPYKRDVNTVFQSYALFPHMTVADNVSFGLERRGIAKAEIRTRVSEVLELVDLAGHERRKSTQLSGGQQQRVALARAIVNNPRVLLLDEPLGALDLKLRKQMQLELKRIQNEIGITFVHVTHDQEEAMTMADTIAVMNQGKIEQLGSPNELYERPQTAFVAGFLGKSNLLDGQVAGDGLVRLADGSEVRARTNGAQGAISIGVRPEKISLGGEGANRLAGKVKESAYIGVATEVVVATSVGELTVFHQNVEAGGVVPPLGSEITISWSPEATFVVESNGEGSPCVAWSGDLVQLQADNPSLKWNVPDDGGMIWTDNMLIRLGGDVEKASTFMNFVYDPKIAAQIAAYVNYVTPVKGAKEVLLKTDPELANNQLIFPDDATLAKVKQFNSEALNNQDYIEKWQSVSGA